MIAPLRRPVFRKMVASQFAAEAGDGVTLVALPLYVFERTNSALATSLTFTAELIGGVILGVVGGVLADAVDRRLVLMVSAVIRAALLVGAFLVDPIWFAVSLGVLARSMGFVDNPSFDALVPGQAEDDLQQVLAIRRLVQAVSITVGPAIGAVAVELVGARSAILLNAGAFVISFSIMAMLPGLDKTLAARRASREGRAFGERVGEMVAGMGVVATTPGVRRLVAYNVFVMMTVAGVMGAAVIWYEVELDASGSWFGLAIASYGIGAALGMGIFGGLHFRLPLPVIIIIATPIYTVAAGMGVLFEVPWLLPLGWLLWGIALGPELVLGEVTIVSNVPEEKLGRAFAGIGVGTTMGMAAGYAVVGPALERYGAKSTILFTAGAVFLLGMSWLGPAVEARRVGSDSFWVRPHRIGAPYSSTPDPTVPNEHGLDVGARPASTEE